VSHLLIVDDDPNTLASLARAFRLAGHEATVADRASRAMELVRSQTFDLIFSDVVMPEKDGIALLEEMRAAGVTTPVVMISGQATVDMAVRATKLGAIDFLEKPLSTDKLGDPLHRFPAVTVSVCNLRPQSRGRVELASADPLRAPLIRQNFLSVDADWAKLRAGVRLARAISAQAALQAFIARELGGPKETDAGIDAHIRATSISVHHPLGTCRMGEVVDEELRVKGVERVRVVDASVMPDMVGGNINAPVMMIAEKAADLIRGNTLAAIH